MKSMALIPVVVAACVGIAALALKVAGVAVNLIDPLAAGIVAATAGILGILPLLRLSEPDAGTIAQRALVGTVLHLFCTCAVAGVFIASQVVNFRGSFVFWLLGAYWVSLAILVRQLRRVMLDMIASLKVQH
jgi:hypothetical protein